MADEPLYTMSIDLSVLNHLGIGLYSNVPAVLSEAVANAWDADATKVEIEIDKDNETIVITDDGFGMTVSDINAKYLKVGYRKRDQEPGKTPKGRIPMGRKGIGKLSVFSIADTVEVYSLRNGEKNGLRMSRQAIEETIRDGETHDYHPEELDATEVDLNVGTRIVLRDLKKRLSGTEAFLRRRLARRFTVIDPAHDFAVEVNSVTLSAKDRDFFNSIEFLWCLGEDSQGVVAKCSGLQKDHVVLDNIVDASQGYRVSGWIGTIDDQRHIDEQNNSIVVFAHGKLIQEDLLTDLKEAGVYSKYIIGEIDAEFMDLDDREDIVTSNRQSVKEDDPRYEALREFVRSVLKIIQNQWTGLRNEVGLKRALRMPVVKEWYDTLQGDNKKYAKQLFGKIESLKIDDGEAKKEIYKSSLLAFEKLALTQTLSVLEAIETEEDFAVLKRLFESIDEYEAVQYYQIVKGRLAVIRDFEKMLPISKERALQQHIFDHLWLLHPSWERASSNQRIEEAVTTEFDKLTLRLTKEERSGRIDIRYKTAANKHIIIELKKYDRKVSATQLVDQVRKYREALRKCLREKFPEESNVIEVICILGAPPDPRDQEEENRGLLGQVGARWITYDQLIAEAQKSYEEYLARDRDVSKLISILDRIDAEFDAASLT